MLKVSLFLTTILVTSSCGGFKLFTPKKAEVDRKIASIMLNDEDQTFIEEIDEKLTSLHSYYVIGQKSLLEFDRLLETTKIEDLYRTKPYLGLMAVKTQVEIIEAELQDLYYKSGKKDLLKSQLEAFSKKSILSALSMENLRERLTHHQSTYRGQIQFSDIAKEYRDLESVREFQVYEKNIEHLSIRFDGKRPASFDTNLRASDFPSKVWAIAFRTAKPQDKIVSNLKAKNIRATFLERSTTDMDQSIRDAGVAWNIDALDWMAQSPDKIIKRTITMMNKTARDSGVILIHAVHGRSIAASGAIIKRLSENDRRTCTLTEIAKDLNQGSEKVCLNN